MRVKVTAEIQEQRLIHFVPPKYRKQAAERRITGVGGFQAIIGTDGHVIALRLISGHPLLVSAAREAARPWVYRPTYLNGEAAEVVTEIAVPVYPDPPLIRPVPPETSPTASIRVRA